MKRSGKPAPEALWTLPELCQLVERALAQSDYSGPANHQIHALPSERAIRFYATSGLLDRPARMQGRTALYSHRHLLQLVALKRLQAQGLQLTQVQQRLYGLDDHGLAALAQLPDWANLQASLAQAPPTPEATVTERPDTAFWEAEPAPPSRAASDGSVPAGGSQVVPMQGYQLTSRVWLLLQSRSVLSAHEHEELSAAAAPLLEWLRAHGH